MEAFSCPNEGCVRVVQRFSSLELHLSFERCSKSLERQTLLDIAKTQYTFLLEEGVGKMPTLKSRELHVTDVSISKAEEGWALKEARKSYRFNEAQKSYLEAKYNIGQTTERKLDADIRASEEEINSYRARHDILSHLQQEHPPVYDQYDICALAKKGTLKSLKLDLLQSLCECFSLKTPVKKVRSKAPYIALLEEMVSCCSCS